jgi:hypothetical protein
MIPGVFIEAAERKLKKIFSGPDFIHEIDDP